jgi:L-asparaginase
MNGTINAARDVTKLHSNRVETFQSLEFGPLGIVDRMGVKFYRVPLRRQTIPIKGVTSLPRVPIVVSYAGVDGDIVRSLITAGEAQGLVIAGFGGGTVAGSMFEAIKEARMKRVPVVITGAPTGHIVPASATPGSVVTTKGIGCVFADYLSPQKAQILLMIAMMQTRESADLQAYFDR